MGCGYPRARFSPRTFSRIGDYFAGNARVLFTTVIADRLIGLSYVVISATLVFIVRPYQGFSGPSDCSS
jgi:hypothetical protein